MTISIIIVSYNVQYFLKQCLNSVLDAIQNIEAEIIVVDNASSDGSVELIESQFPSVHLIKNKENLGFGKANNQAIELATGKYTLLLNPDTLISTEAIEKPLAFMEAHPNTGALGVKLLDGSGNYHMESKRGLPNIWSAFCKMTGIYKLAPKSKLFNHYYLGHLDENKTQNIEVICGAYVLSLTSILKRLNGFDPDFFMYGEDIDLSYRITDLGYDIVYFPESSIVHFKGESSKKLNWKYIQSFYGSMVIYLRKHQKGIGRALIPILSFVIFVIAALSYVSKIFSKAIWAIIDFILLVAAYQCLVKLWGLYYHQDSSYFAHQLINYFLGFNALLYIGIMYVYGKYDQYNKFVNVLKAVGIALVMSVFIYSILPETVRFSRFLIFGFGIISLIIASMTFYFNHLLGCRNVNKKSSYIIVGEAASAKKLCQIITENNESDKYLGFISPNENEQAIGQMDELDRILKQFNPDDIIFSTKELDYTNILKVISRFGPKYSYKLASNDNVSILSSKNAKKQGEIITVNVKFNIQEAIFKRLKRILDVTMAVILLVLSPIILLLSKNFRKKFSMIFSVIFSNKHLIGYYNQKGELPKLKPAMFNLDDICDKDVDELKIEYAKNYNPILDLDYLLQALRR